MQWPTILLDHYMSIQSLQVYKEKWYFMNFIICIFVKCIQVSWPLVATCKIVFNGYNLPSDATALEDKRKKQ